MNDPSENTGDAEGTTTIQKVAHIFEDGGLAEVTAGKRRNPQRLDGDFASEGRGQPEFPAESA
jgi:hypothetical protein